MLGNSGKWSIVQLLVVLWAVQAFVNAEEDPEANKGEQQVERHFVRVTHDGHEFAAPTYANLKEIHEARRMAHSETAKGIFSTTKDLLHNLFIKEWSQMRAAPGFAYNLITYGKKRQRDQEQLDKMLNDRLSLPQGNGQSAGALMKKVLATETSEKFTQKRQVYDRLVFVLDGLQKLINNSPVGLYLDWNKLTVDGRGLNEITAPVISFLRRKNYYIVTFGLDKIVSYVGGIKNKE